MNKTQETDARTYVPSLGASTVPAEFARKLERECDEMREDLKTIVNAILKKGGKTVLNTTALKRLEELHEAEQERDEAREALMKIEDLFIYGTDIYADREKMGNIATDYLEGL